MHGFIKIHRTISENSLWNDKPYSKGQAWIDLLLRVNHAEKNVLVNGEWINVEPGETIWSLKSMATRWGWSINKVGRFIDGLQSEHMVMQKRKSKYTKITVVNWNKYQQNGNQTEIKRKPNGNQTETNKNVKNVKNEKNIYVNANASTRDFFYKLVNELGYTETTLYTDARRKKLQARLKKFSEEQLLTVAKAIYNSPFHQGDNPSGKRYGTIDFILRSDEKIDEWLQADTKKITYKADW